jgi:Xaa-Pro dipeptidase
VFEVPETEYQARLEWLRRLMEQKGVHAVYMSAAINFKYFTGFDYLPTERPAAIVVPVDGEVVFLGPMIERDHIRLQTRLVSRVFSYLDYPGETHPMKSFAGWLTELRLSGKRIATDNPNFYPGTWGYRGIDLSELMPDTKFIPVGDELYEARLIKSRSEVTLVRESVRWGHLAHELLQKYVAPGVYDFEASAKASLEATLIMKKTLGPKFKGSNAGPFSAHAGIRGQVGEHSAYPHSMSIEREIRMGDIVITGASADVDGYHSELERNLFVGEPDERVRRLHNIALRMQDAAFEALKPGRPCSDADRAAYRVAKDNGVTDLLRHHSGHGMGLEGHERPFLDIGDQTLLRPGMVLSVEPGLYVPKLGGFRHSDTVVITDDGASWLNEYPRDTDSLTIML